MRPVTRVLSAILLIPALSLAGCDDDGPTRPRDREFLDGTPDDPRIGLVVASTGRALSMFQLGDPTTTRRVALGASNAVTPVSLASRGPWAVVPLGNAASVALVDAREERVARFFLFAEGNATGAAFSDDETVFAANTSTDQVGRFRVGQPSDQITGLVEVAPSPTAVLFDGERVLVVSANLDETFNPLGESVITALDPGTLEVLGTVSTGGTNAQSAALGPDGRLYVINTGDFVGSGSLGVVDPADMTLERVVEGMGVGPGSVSVDTRGLAYVSGFFFGTLVWDTGAGAFVRGPDDPVCAPLPDGQCRGAFAAVADEDGDLYQAFFGTQDLRPWLFVYDAGSFALADSVDVGSGPAAVEIREF